MSNAISIEELYVYTFVLVPILGRTSASILPSLRLSTGSVDQIRKSESMREQFRQNMQRYFESFAERKGAIEWLSLAHPHRINVHLDNNDYLHLSFDPELVFF